LLLKKGQPADMERFEKEKDALAKQALAKAASVSCSKD
jgi:hypothetical protein